MMLDVMDMAALKPVEIDLREKLDALNKSFDSQVKPENGYFGITEIDKGNGYTFETDDGDWYLVGRNMLDPKNWKCLGKGIDNGK